MAPSVSKEELMRNSDPLVWSLSGGNSSPESEPNRICERMWVFLNSKVCNVIVVALVKIETLVIVSKLLITLEVVQDPYWRGPSAANCSVNESSPMAESSSRVSPKVQDTGFVLANISIAILTLFLFEIVLRLASGRLRYITQGIEVFDAVVVIIVFSLGVAFLTSPIHGRSGRDGVLTIIILRIWRLRRIFKSITEAAQIELSQVVHTYHREKTQAEHKVDILILKVEDLEHEVAYLKEKLKKTERESVIVKKRRSKEGSSHGRTCTSALISTCVATTATIAVETVPMPCPSMATQTGASTENLDKPQHIVTTGSLLQDYADKLAEDLLAEVIMDFVNRSEKDSVFSSPPIHSGIGETPKFKTGTKLKRRSDGSMESGYGSGASSINWDRFRGAKTVKEGPVKPSEESRNQITVIANVTAVSPGGHLGLKCPESSPESGYGSSASAPQRTSSASPAEVTDISSGSAKHADIVFLFPDPPNQSVVNSVSRPTVGVQDPAGVELEWLDEQSEIERIKRVEFDPNRKDKGVPMTSL